MRVIGIDPGTLALGISVVERKASALNLLHLQTLWLKKYEDPLLKLSTVSRALHIICKTYKPDTLAIEMPFFGKNAQVMLKLGRVQGVCIGTCLDYVSKVAEYAPRKIKKSVTGNGNASKEQVAYMVRKTLRIPESLEKTTEETDATDATAAAITYLLESERTIPSGNGSKKSNGWKEFLDKNPDRIHS